MTTNCEIRPTRDSFNIGCGYVPVVRFEGDADQITMTLSSDKDGSTRELRFDRKEFAGMLRVLATAAAVEEEEEDDE